MVKPPIIDSKLLYIDGEGPSHHLLNLAGPHRKFDVFQAAKKLGDPSHCLLPASHLEASYLAGPPTARGSENLAFPMLLSHVIPSGETPAIAAKPMNKTAEIL